MQAAVPTARLMMNESMKNHTSFKIGGPADCLVVPQNEMELIALFLPDILSYFGLSKEANQMDNLKRQVINEIIPQIISKMDAEIEKSLQHLEEEMLSEIEDSINSLIDIETEALNNALNMKNSKSMAYDLLLKDMQSDLRNIEAMI